MGQNVIINHVTYSGVPSVTIPKEGGGTAIFYDTNDASAVAANILSGKSAYGSAGKVNGSMANNGALTGAISTVAGTYTIPAGYTTGGSVSIDATEQSYIISDNIVAGATILGVQGNTANVDTSDATATSATIFSGATAYVDGVKIVGALVTPVISQDSTTYVLSIS